ncbi:MAG TPA: diaminopimelate epimerase [Myxococcota bacterium]|jgi:diaminopimelate epimerase|nr:diaminopimelate epimerase [Myxococcota bacterium]
MPLGRDEFAKYHALGNDYVVVDGDLVRPKLDATRVRALCNRHTGIGSDGILALHRPRKGALQLRIWNPDGSEAEKSGNGVRIFARFLWDFRYVRSKELEIETPGGVVAAGLSVANGDVRSIRVDMGRASFQSRDIPMLGPPREVVDEPLRVGSLDLRVTCVSVGNPHCVRFVPNLHPEVLRSIGPQLENHPIFPNRTNVQLAHVRSRSEVAALIWERGAGETLASGSSSCAVAVAAHRLGLVDRKVDVLMPGGSLHIEIGSDWSLRMTGPATPVYRGALL